MPTKIRSVKSRLKSIAATLKFSAVSRYIRLKQVARANLNYAPIAFENWRFAGRRKGRLVILDDIFPHLLSAFRIAEFNSYLAAFDSCVVSTSATGYTILKDHRPFRDVVADYVTRYPQFDGRVSRFDARRSLRGQFVYFVFLGNALAFLPTIEKYNAPFAFTLYPGGSFRLNDKDSDALLRRVSSSPNLKKVIVTQKATYEYLIEKQFLDEQRIKFIYGGVFAPHHLSATPIPKRHYLADKDTFDICFVAYKYTEAGRDKGYDTFVAVAKLLAATHKDIFFHVVGSFERTDLDVSELGERIRFYGTRLTEFFPEFYSGMDIILAPNTADGRAPGEFDGFPTGSSIEAGLCGVAVFCADPLNQNIRFKDGEEIQIIPPNVEEICHLVDLYYKRNDTLVRLAANGQAAFNDAFSIHAQMQPRLQLISDCMRASGVGPES